MMNALWRTTILGVAMVMLAVAPVYGHGFGGPGGPGMGGGRGMLFPALLRALDDPDPWVRYFALRSIATFENATAAQCTNIRPLRGAQTA